MLKQIKIIFIVLFLTINLYATNWYCDGALTGTDNGGTSWADAWEAFDQINWASLGPGDYLYISGGTDTVQYSSQLGIPKGGTAGNYLYIMAGRYAPNPTGHSGRVIVRNSTGAGLLIEAAGGAYRQWIYVKGIEFRNSYGEGARITYDTKHIVIDSCKFIDSWGMGIFLAGNDNISLTDTNYVSVDTEIKNCTVISLADGDVIDDNIQMKYNVDVKIHDNYLLQRNRQSWVTGGVDPHHVDNIQIAYGSTNVKIYNNVCIVDSAANGHCMILGVASRTADRNDTIVVYNNFMYNGGGIHNGYSCRSHQIFYFRGSENQDSPSQYIPVCYFFNNTEVVANEGILAISDYYGSYDRNNILLKLGSNGVAPIECDAGSYGLSWNSAYFGVPTSAPENYKYIDSCTNNLMWQEYGNNQPRFGGNMWIPAGGGSAVGISTLSDFTFYGGSLINENPDLSEVFYPDLIFPREPFDRESHTYLSAIEPTSPAIDTGLDFTWLVEKLNWNAPEMTTDDLLGNPRTEDWDIGCYEYGAAAPPTEVKKVRVIIIQ